MASYGFTHIHLLRNYIQQVLEKSEENIFNKVKSLHRQIINNNKSTIDTAEILRKMKFLAENLPMFDRRINSEIDQALQIFDVKQGVLGIMKLIVELEKSDLGVRLINEHSCLAGEGWRRRRDKMQKQDDHEYVIKQLSGDEISTNILRSNYTIFREKYDQLVKNNLQLIDSTPNKEPDVDLLIIEIKHLIGSIIKTPNPTLWDDEFVEKIPILLSYIFAVWTLKNTKHYNISRGIEIAQSYLLIPHVAQVIAVFRLLGIGYNHQMLHIGNISNTLINNLIEIGTGEGKSVVMAITACVFALTDIDVNCSCYSEILSNRDRNEFLSVFKSLGIEERIKYGTFDKLCEQFLNEKCDIRQIVNDMIVKNQNTLTTIDIKTNTRTKILLIDEVDVFLSERFFGGTYSPIKILIDPPIKMLLDSIWLNKATITLDNVKLLHTYKTCITQYSNWIFLFDEAIKDMLFALQTYKSLQHIVRNNKIAYVQDERVVDLLIYGYNTIWAYYHEKDLGNITDDSLKANVGLIVNCGIFSYAEMPHSFGYIAGVTGTLRTLAQSEKDILTNIYRVQKNTFMPSVFGASNPTYNSANDVHVVKESEYFLTIYREIDTIRKANREILVFFESKEKLMRFYYSSELSPIKSTVQIITEEVAVKDRELYIKRAATVGKVTLLSRIFGRGTDFICDNQKILDKGGIHVLQTFFSQELAEEYQIMGRGARQGDKGSYSMILLDKNLEQFLGSNWKNELHSISPSSHYETINRARNVLYENKCSAKHLSVEQYKHGHRASKQFLNSLYKGNMEDIKKFLTKQNLGQCIVANPSRTIVLIAATLSLSPLLSFMKDIIHTLFDHVSDILAEKRLPSSLIQMQFCFYRNYKFRENQILQVSPWRTRPFDLRVFLNTINIEGENCDETMEIALEHVVNESKTKDSVSQVILIGDTPPNTKEKVKENRTFFGETYWKNTTFKEPKNYLSELKELRKKKIPVHTLYLNSLAENSFQEIAKMTGGRCAQLHMNSINSTEILIRLIAEEIFRKAV
ncbi:hypothetical protein I4U23_022168 [Adineta vaga]|nr:hypothetical protein I4U23_022168 [Adineta vaga]